MLPSFLHPNPDQPCSLVPTASLYSVAIFLSIVVAVVTPSCLNPVVTLTRIQILDQQPTLTSPSPHSPPFPSPHHHPHSHSQPFPSPHHFPSLSPSTPVTPALSPSDITETHSHITPTFHPTHSNNVTFKWSGCTQHIPTSLTPTLSLSAIVTRALTQPLTLSHTITLTLNLTQAHNVTLTQHQTTFSHTSSSKFYSHYNGTVPSHRQAALKHILTSGNFRTTAECHASFRGRVMITSVGPVSVDSLSNANIS